MVCQHQKHFLAIRVHKDSTEGYIFNNFLIKYFNLSWKLLIETLKDDIKSVVMGKPGLEYREDSLSKLLFHNLGEPEVHRKERKG